MATDLYGHLAPRLRLVPSDVADHLHAMAATYDVLYSVFGAVDFTEPRELLPAASAALRPGGRLVLPPTTDGPRTAETLLVTAFRQMP
jgi:hypothetical protein